MRQTNIVFWDGWPTDNSGTEYIKFRDNILHTKTSYKIKMLERQYFRSDLDTRWDLSSSQRQQTREDNVTIHNKRPNLTF